MQNEPLSPPPANDELSPDWPDKLSRESIVIEGRTFVVDRPAQSGLVTEDPVSPLASAENDFLPYWSELWPASLMLAKAVLREPWTPGTQALEIGCGLGLPGIAALAAGLQVTFSDYDSTALRFAAHNARLNGHASFQTLKLDWRYPPADLQFPVLLASDLVYEMSNVEPLVNFLKKVLLPGGLCLLANQDRLPSHRLHESLASSGLALSTDTLRLTQPGRPRLKGTLYRIRRQ